MLLNNIQTKYCVLLETDQFFYLENSVNKSSNKGWVDGHYIRVYEHFAGPPICKYP